MFIFLLQPSLNLVTQPCNPEPQEHMGRDENRTKSLKWADDVLTVGPHKMFCKIQLISSHLFFQKSVLMAFPYRDVWKDEAATDKLNAEQVQKQSDDFPPASSLRFLCAGADLRKFHLCPKSHANTGVLIWAERGTGTAGASWFSLTSMPI